MQVSHGIHNRPASSKPSVATLGNFDGLHYGHQELLKKVQERAKVLGALKIVMTFDPHPVQVLHPERALKRLFPREDLAEQLEKRGFDELILEPFSREFSQLTPEVFFREYLLKPLNLKALVVCHDFSFGVDRTGNLENLTELCMDNDVELDMVEPLAKEGGVVSSSRIRKALQESDVELVAKMLGRPFSLRGIVEKGDQRGRKLGFPTANISPENELIPKNGVYLTRVFVQNKTYMAITNVGLNPTFDAAALKPRVESHLLDFDGDLYGLKMQVEFLRHRRPEKKFASVEELVAHIRQDAQWAREQIRDFR